MSDSTKWQIKNGGHNFTTCSIWLFMKVVRYSVSDFKFVKFKIEEDLKWRQNIPIFTLNIV